MPECNYSTPRLVHLFKICMALNSYILQRKQPLGKTFASNIKGKWKPPDYSGSTRRTDP